MKWTNAIGKNTGSAVPNMDVIAIEWSISEYREWNSYEGQDYNRNSFESNSCYVMYWSEVKFLSHNLSKSL